MKKVKKKGLAKVLEIISCDCFGIEVCIFEIYSRTGFCYARVFYAIGKKVLNEKIVNYTTLKLDCNFFEEVFF